ncbi:MAG: bifunctional demethylmenaquinone methyltransferase/2-methoxy-6-polyprenyl-1,4-benzoquinol methylase UbiE [Verrucomicrobiota bacterium]
MPEAHSVQSMFAGIAHRYDLANRVLSGGFDIGWRRQLVKSVAAQSPETVVDLATGSGDVAFALRNGLPQNVSVRGLDFCEPMLVEARKKQEQRGVQPEIEFSFGDCLDLGLPDQSVDVITISFGYRNLENRTQGLEEFKRVLTPGGSLFILEFSQPYRPLRPVYYLYLKYLLPHLASALTRDRGAYNYLACSIEDFPDHKQLSQEIKSAGFKEPSARRMTGGIVALHHART